MATHVRVDGGYGYKWVDWDVDQGGHWNETVTMWPAAPNVGSPVDVTGYTATLVVKRSGIETPVLYLTTEIVVGGVAGTFAWDVPADQMAALIRPVYLHQLTLMPGGNGELARPLLKGRVLVRASVAI